MSTPREQYDEMLDELDDESKLHLIDHVPFAKVLEELDPIAYRCGCSDFQPTCDECGHEFWADDPDEPALCQDCAKEAEAPDDEAVPLCAQAMGCLCAGHARGNPADEPCDTTE